VTEGERTMDVKDPRVEELMLGQSYNCAEAVLLICSERYGLDLTQKEIALLSAFGGGMGTGRTCGAVAGALAVLGRLTVKDRAHSTEQFRPTTAGLVHAMDQALGSTECREIMPVFRTKELGCTRTVATTLDALDRYLKENGIV